MDNEVKHAYMIFKELLMKSKVSLENSMNFLHTNLKFGPSEL
jgi:hypothetical protein